MQVTFNIVYDTDTENVQVAGPTNDIGLCHLILDLARQSLLGFTMQNIKDRRIVTPAGPIAVPSKPS